MLDWDLLLRGGVLEPARRGEPVSYRPPKWNEHDRSGAVVVPSGARPLIVEGVGAIRQALTPLLDARVWVQADAAALERRNQARVAAGEITAANHRAWMAEEDPFLLADRAWERATVVVAGTPELPHDHRSDAVVAAGLETSLARRPQPRSSGKRCALWPSTATSSTQSHTAVPTPDSVRYDRVVRGGDLEDAVS